MKVPAWIQTRIDRFLARPRIVTTRRVLERFGTAGGGLLAGGLTYAALFALLPALLLLTSVLGLLVEDPERQRAIVESLGQSLPPLRGIVDATLERIAQGATISGTVGLIGLAWGASRFYGSLDDAFARIFVNAPPRNIIAQMLRGVVSVVLLVSMFIVGLALTGIASFLAEQTTTRFGGSTVTFWAVVTPLMTLVVFVVGMGVIYRMVPARHVPWTVLLLPAVLVGLGLTLVTQLFSYVAPRLILNAAVYGTFVAIFAAMIWLSTGFQLMLLGAAWIRERLGEPPPPFLEG
jgi:membrane protein